MQTTIPIGHPLAIKRTDKLHSSSLRHGRVMNRDPAQSRDIQPTAKSPDEARALVRLLARRAAREIWGGCTGPDQGSAE